ncbi:hypothetical protein H9P43_000380 [Blastocladiella emersonii ATCC 22665]|nr:hypothetical protein H9P43_000380 [Blastocladiella emersonii ATCC 22665]
MNSMSSINGVNTIGLNGIGIGKVTPTNLRPVLVRLVPDHDPAASLPDNDALFFCCRACKSRITVEIPDTRPESIHAARTAIVAHYKNAHGLDASLRMWGHVTRFPCGTARAIADKRAAAAAAKNSIGIASVFAFDDEDEYEHGHRLPLTPSTPPRAVMAAADVLAELTLPSPLPSRDASDDEDEDSESALLDAEETELVHVADLSPSKCETKLEFGSPSSLRKRSASDVDDEACVLIPAKRQRVVA